MSGKIKNLKAVLVKGKSILIKSKRLKKSFSFKNENSLMSTEVDFLRKQMSALEKTFI